MLFPLGLLAAVAAVGAAATSAAEDVGLVDAERARNEIFEVGPDCAWIKFRGLPEGVGGEQAVKALELARDYYLVPRIEEGLTAGIDDPRDLALMILDEMFPTCTWPPADLFSSHQLVYLAVAAWVTTTLEGMGVPVTDPVMPPQDAAQQAPGATGGEVTTLPGAPPPAEIGEAPTGATTGTVPADAQAGVGPSNGLVAAVGVVERPPGPADEPYDSGFWSETNLAVSPEEWVRTRLFEYGTAQAHLVNDDPIPPMWKPLLDWQRQYNTLSSSGALPPYAGGLQPTGELDAPTRNAFQLVWEEQIGPQAWQTGLIDAAA